MKYVWDMLLQIKKALGIEAVHTLVPTWRHIAAKGNQGAQIDLLLDRADCCINLCEMKFATVKANEHSIGRVQAEILMRDLFK